MSAGGGFQTLAVALPGRSYPIHIGAGLLEQGELLASHLPGRQALLVTDEQVGPHYLERLASALGRAARAGGQALELASVVLPAGEEHKSLTTLSRIFDALAEARMNRQASIVALGGGVVGDMAGFAAACWQRGIAHVQVPTTLLAQVDSSVGGKTAVNHPLGKNLIGAFHQPAAVIIDTDTLATLDGRELRAGLAEVIKYGVIRDAGFFAWLEQRLEALLARDPEALVHAIRRSCELKAEVVRADEREAGPRALLNLGHTFGHAIEAGTDYRLYRHGEAVALGMVLAARVAEAMGWMSAADRGRIERIVRALGIAPGLPEGLDSERMLALMARDKKVLDSGPRLVVPRGIGHAVVTGEVPAEVLVRVLDTAPSIPAGAISA